MHSLFASPHIQRVWACQQSSQSTPFSHSVGGCGMHVPQFAFESLFSASSSKMARRTRQPTSARAAILEILILSCHVSSFSRNFIHQRAIANICTPHFHPFAHHPGYRYYPAFYNPISNCMIIMSLWLSLIVYCYDGWMKMKSWKKKNFEFVSVWYFWIRLDELLDSIIERSRIGKLWIESPFLLLELRVLDLRSEAQFQSTPDILYAEWTFSRKIKEC